MGGCHFDSLHTAHLTNASLVASLFRLLSNPPLGQPSSFILSCKSRSETQKLIIPTLITLKYLNLTHRFGRHH